MLGKKCLHLNRNGLKIFAKNLIDAIRELWKLERQFCDLTQNDTNKLIKNQITSNSRKTSTEDNNILHNFNDVSTNLKVHQCRFENLPIGSYSYKNNTLKIWHS